MATQENDQKKITEVKPSETNGQQPEVKQQQNDLSAEDIPDSTNESTGVPGSGQRQDTN